MWFISLDLNGFSFRLKSTKTDRRYKQGKKPKENKRNVVSSQENAIRNGQAVSAVSAASSGPYVKRWDIEICVMHCHMAQAVNLYVYLIDV